MRDASSSIRTARMPSVLPRPTVGVRLRSPAALALYVVLLASAAGWLRPLELRLLDLRAALSRHTVNSDVVLVEIDERSLHRLNSWPWPRSYHARLLDVLRRAGVKDVFYDVDFSSVSSPGEDRRLARALSSYPRDRIMLPAFIQPLSGLAKGRLVISKPLPELAGHSTLVSVNLRPDRDGLVRRITTQWPVTGEDIAPAALRIAGLYTYRRSSLQVDYGIRPRSIPRLSFADVLAGHFNPGVLRNKHVIVGATAVELGDRLPVPVYRSLAGPVVQGLAYLTLREGGLGTLPRAVDLCAAVGLAVFMGFIFRRTAWRGALLWVSGTIATLLVSSLYAYRQWHLVLTSAAPVLQLMLGYGIFLVARLEQQRWRLLIQGLDLRRKDAMMANVVNHSIDGIFTVSDSGVIKSANPAALAMFGVSSKGLLGTPVRDLFVNLPASGTAGDVPDDILGGGGVAVERQAKRRDGSTFPVELIPGRMDFDGGRLYTVFVRDITERIRQRQRLEHQATHDPLTGLANRHLLNRKLQQLLREDAAGGSRASLLLLDLDRFKEINDSLGHGVGDQLLVQIARRFSTYVTDAMVLARIGGDEFAILLPENDENGRGGCLAQTLLDSLAVPFVVNGMALEVGASIGIAHFPGHGGDAAALLQHADTAMYAAKRTATGMAYYETEFTRRNVLRMKISTGLREAISHSRLMMYYQPKLALPGGRVTGCEALLRWNHPHLGFIPPDEIIDVAESTGLIWPLTEWSLIQALNEVRAWRLKAYDIRVAVNLSARLLQDAMLIERLMRWLNRCAGDPRWLTLEITETALMHYPDRALKNAKALSAHGIELSIDDFGTGYSSLSYLRNLPVSELKIDKSFVTDMLSEGNDWRIVKSTVDLAHNLGLKVVAEGVENEAILDAVKDLGCDIAQGYHVSRPVPAAAFAQWLEGHCGHDKPRVIPDLC